MDGVTEVFSFDIKSLWKDGIEKNFEMLKAERFVISSQLSQDWGLYWIHGEDNFPEKIMTIGAAKRHYGHLWPEQCDEFGVAQMIFELVSLQAVIERQNLEISNLKEEISRLRGGAEFCRSRSMEIFDQSMSTMIAENTTVFMKPMPGYDTIMACAEKGPISRREPTVDLTENVRQKVKAIQHMFCGDDSDMMSRQQEATLSMAVNTLSDSTTDRSYAHGDAAGNVPSLQQRGVEPAKPQGLQIFKDPEGLVYRQMAELKEPQQQQQQGLQIFKDPEGLMDRQHQRQPLRAPPPRLSPRSKENQPPPLPPPSINDENAQIEPSSIQPSTLTSSLEFEPAITSTSVFSRPRDSRNQSSPPKKQQQEETLEVDFNPLCASTKVFKQPPKAEVGGGPAKTGSKQRAGDVEFEFNPPAASTKLFARPLPPKGSQSQVTRKQDPEDVEVEFNPPVASTSVFARPPAFLQSRPKTGKECLEPNEMMMSPLSSAGVPSKPRVGAPHDVEVEFNPPAASTSVFARPSAFLKSKPAAEEKPHWVGSAPKDVEIDFNPPAASTSVFAPPPAFLKSKPRTEPAEPPDVEVAFNPSAASTSIFGHLPPSLLKPRQKTDVDSPPRRHQHENADVDDMEMGNTPPRDDSLDDLFEQFCHTPDLAARPRVDATKFIDAFLSNKDCLKPRKARGDGDGHDEFPFL